MGSVVSAKVANLTQGVLNSMLLSKLKIGTMWLLVSLIAFGAGLFIYHTAMAQQDNVERVAEETPIAKPKAKTEKEATKEESKVSQVDEKCAKAGAPKKNCLT
jgi:hypothetical protein